MKTRTARVRDTDGTWKNPLSKEENSRVVNSQPKGSAVPDAAKGPYIQRINNDAREDEMEDNMQAVGSVLGNLKNMAADMGEEISRQNKQLDRIDRKVIIFCFPFDFLFLCDIFVSFRLKTSISKLDLPTNARKSYLSRKRTQKDCIS